MELTKIEMVRDLTNKIISDIVDHGKDYRTIHLTSSFLYLELINLGVRLKIALKCELPEHKEQFLEMLKEEQNTFNDIINQFINSKLDSLYEQLKESYIEAVDEGK